MSESKGTDRPRLIVIIENVRNGVPVKAWREIDLDLWRRGKLYGAMDAEINAMLREVMS
jgi:hypothetical protein